MEKSLRIALADDDAATREHLAAVLTGLGHQVEAVEDGQQLVEKCRAWPPDLVLTDIKMPHLDGLEAVEVICRERQVPVVLVTAYHGPDLFERAGACDVMAYLIKPIEEGELQATIRLAVLRFRQHNDARQETASLRQELEDRKVIERAKGVLMRRLRLDEGDAYRRLRKLAGNENRKLAEVARTVLDSDLVFQVLEKL